MRVGANNCDHSNQRLFRLINCVLINPVSTQPKSTEAVLSELLWREKNDGQAEIHAHLRKREETRAESQRAFVFSAVLLSLVEIRDF